MAKSRMSKTCSPVMTRTAVGDGLHADRPLDRPGHAVEGQLALQAGSGTRCRSACTRAGRPWRSGNAGRRCGAAARRRRGGCRSAARRRRWSSRRSGARLVCRTPSIDGGLDEPVSPMVPKLRGPTVERTSISTTERSGISRKRCGRRGPTTGSTGAASGRSAAGLVLIGLERHQAAPTGRSRRHRRPARRRGPSPSPFDLGQHGVGGPGGLVAAQDLARGSRAPP